MGDEDGERMMQMRMLGFIQTDVEIGCVCLCTGSPQRECEYIYEGLCWNC